MSAKGAIGLVNYRNPHYRQPISNLICHCKVVLFSGRLALLDQVRDRCFTQLTGCCTGITVGFGSEQP